MPADEPEPTADLPPQLLPPPLGPETVRRKDTSVPPADDPAATADLPDPAVGTRTHDPSAATGGLPSGHGTYPPDPLAVEAVFAIDPLRTGEFTTPTAGKKHKPVPKAPNILGYEILGELGRGGMGVVWKARHVALDRVVALKMILAGPQASGAVIDRFLGEAQAIARFQHPNITQIYEIGEHDGMPFFSLEFVDGGPLSAKIAKEPQPPRFAAETAETLARAMQYAHDRNIIHRDLKPANVLLGTDGVAKITDFGLAKKLEGDSGQTQSGQILGTPSYMAPEQARGETESIGPPADVYALGAILYDLLTGRPPFTGSSVLDTLEMVRKREPVPPSELTVRLPRDVETICLKCLSKEPAKRYATAAALADDLRRWLDGRTILARPVSAPEKAVRWAKRNPVGAGFIGFIAASALVMGGLAAFAFQQKEAADVARVQALNEKDEKEIARKAAEAAKVVAEEQTVEKEKARKAEEAAKVEAAANFQRARTREEVARNTITGMLLYIDLALANNATYSQQRLAILNKILDDLSKVRDEVKKNPLPGREESVTYARIGQAYLRGNRITEAADSLRTAHTGLLAFYQANPTVPNNAAAAAAAGNQLADCERRLGNGAKGRELYAGALALRNARLTLAQAAGDPKSIADAEYDVATSLGLIAKCDLEAGEPATAFAGYEAAATAFAALPDEIFGRLQRARVDRAEVLTGLGESHLRLGRPADARKAFAAAGTSDVATGDLKLMIDRDIPAAGKVYDAAAEKVEQALAKTPDNLSLRRTLGAIRYRQGFVAGKLKKPADATMLFADCLKIRTDLAKTDPRDAQGRIDLMLALGRAGKPAEAEKFADELLALSKTDRRILFQSACGLAVAGGTGTDAANKRCRERAVKVVDDLIAAGWQDKYALETDPDLDAIRAEPDFVAHLSKLPSPK